MSTDSSSSFTSSTEAGSRLRAHLIDLLSRERGIDLSLPDENVDQSIPQVLEATRDRLLSISKPIEAEAIDQVHDKITRTPDFGGLGLTKTDVPSKEQYDEVLFNCKAWIESVKSKESTRSFLDVNSTRAQGARPMTLAEKIFTQHMLSGGGSGSNQSSLKVGDVCRVGVDWVIASELSWSGMAKAQAEMGSPGIWRNDRLWIAGDHIVHPTIYDHPKIRTFIETAEKAKRDFNLTEFQGFNYSIMHTEYVRERAEPGMLVVGSDSHTCSAGAVGCLSIGLGSADVTMTVSLGETWFKVPESILIEFVGEPTFGISGKDVILHILKELKRNTVAGERIVEFAGPGAKHLSCDARFAICNMCAEFGAITGAFVPDEVTFEYINRRRAKGYRSSSVYFRPDEGAEYAGKFSIDLSKVQPGVAVYPNPDDVVPVSQMAGTPVDGVFIGACTTTEEELVLGALVLKVGLAKGLHLAEGKRHYVPGSLPIVQKLQQLGLLEIYQEAGFTRGPPGCSLCVGLSAEKAAEGETWLTSQNRNFQNRMGKGSFGHLSSAMVCAASAFSMTITGLDEFLKDIDVDFFRSYKNLSGGSVASVPYVEPKSVPDTNPPALDKAAAEDNTEPLGTIESRIVTLPDFVDTDALAPGPALMSCVTDEDFGKHVLEYTHPDFRSKVAGGKRVVVAGRGFGVGSSREMAVSALKGAGVQAVIARSFGFIYARNQPALGLLGIVMTDDAFYEAAQEGRTIAIDVPSRTIRVEDQEFPFTLSEMEYKLTVNRGLACAYNRFGKAIWQAMMATDATDTKPVVNQRAAQGDSRLNW